MGAGAGGESLGAALESDEFEGGDDDLDEANDSEELTGAKGAKGAKDAKRSKDFEEEQVLPDFIKDESGPHTPLIKEGKTNPPKHFNENTLLGAMATAGKQVDDDELKEALKEKGIGTPATRAAIIETLIQRQYIKRSKKTLTVTPEGRYLIAIIQDPQLKSPELTGVWESKLRKMERGELDANSFMKEITDFTCAILQDSDCMRIDPDKLGPCPLCHSETVKGKRGVGCSKWKEGCKFVLWSNYKGVELSIRQLQNLLQRRILLTPVTTSEGKRVILTLTSKGQVLEVAPPVAQKRTYGADRANRPDRANRAERKDEKKVKKN